jgi:hypothetical chaperone protein
MIACGLDFGTSNSAIGVARDKTAGSSPIEASNTLMPSAVFFDYETEAGAVRQRGHLGLCRADRRPADARAEIDPGLPLINEETSLGGRKVPLTEVVEIFVRHLKHMAEAFAGQEITCRRARPAGALRRRRRPGRMRGRRRCSRPLPGARAFATSPSSIEPIAAAHHYEQTVQSEELALIADIGGGTSDFSIIRVGPERPRVRRSQSGRAGDRRRARGRHRFRHRPQSSRR